MTVAADVVPPARRGEGIGYYSLAQTVSMAVGPALAFTVLGDGEFSRVFVVAGLTGLTALLLAWWIRHPHIRSPAVSLSVGAMWEGRVAWMALAALFIALGYSGIVGFVSLYGQQLQVGNPGVFFTLYAVGMIVGRLVAGRVQDRQGPGLVVGVGLLLLFLAYLCLALWRTAAGFMVAGLVFGLGYGATIPSLQAMALDVVPPARRGAANGTLFGVFDVGMAVGGYLLGLVAEAAGGYPAVFLVAAVLLGVSAVLFFGRVMPEYRSGG
jgi:predicted MFS family arabinose efflux permease